MLDFLERQKNKFTTFLFKKRSNKEILKLNVYFFVVFEIYIYSLSLITYIITGEGFNSFKEMESLIDDVYLLMSLPLLIFLYALLEEVIFRLPLALFLHKKVNSQSKIIYTILLQIFFILLHFSDKNTADLLLVNITVSSFIFVVIFIISGANEKKYFKALFIVTIYHSISNLSVGFPKIIYDLYSKIFV